MSKLIEMRHRIKVVQTIKKVTHAMRLIAMSTHARVKNRMPPLKIFEQTIHTLVQNIRAEESGWTHNIIWPDVNQKMKQPLLILIGSQKGLCATFNTNLLSFFNADFKRYKPRDTGLIVVGKKIIEQAQSSLNSRSITMQFPNYTQSKVQSIAQEITDHLWHVKKPYTSVIIYFNQQKTFFMQLPTKYVLIPFQALDRKESPTVLPKEPYLWQQEPKKILDQLAFMLIKTTLQGILYKSLIAEQAARFIAMDSSTRNATNLIENMRIDYNKLRQAKITRELTDLIASF